MEGSPSGRFKLETQLTLGDDQFIGQEEDLDDRVVILSPINRNELWSLSKLIETIEFINSDPDVRHLITIFREERRNVFGDKAIDYSMLKSCCQIFLSEHTWLTRTKLKQDYEQYERAINFYDECLTDSDLERLPGGGSLPIPEWLTAEKANELNCELLAF